MVKWSRVLEGGGMEVSLPVSVCPGLDLELTAHLSGDRDGPPLTLCCVPADASDVGVFEVGKVEVAPSGERPDTDENGEHTLSVDYDSRVAIVSVDLATPNAKTRSEGLAELKWAVQKAYGELQAQLEESGPEVDVLLDRSSGRVACVRVKKSHAALPPDRLSFEVNPVTYRVDGVNFRYGMPFGVSQSHGVR